MGPSSTLRTDRGRGVFHMKRFLLVLIIGFAMASYADAEAQPCSNGVDFAKKRVALIIAPFSPHPPLTNPMHDNPASPYGSVDTVDTAYMPLLERAFCIASQDVQGALNKLDYVFVTTDANWQYGDVGVWSAKNGMKYIIITSSTLDRILKTSSLAAEENDLYTKLFNTAFSSISDNGATSSEAAALAVLGHELGHVVFAATNADGRPGKNPRKPTDPESLFL